METEEVLRYTKLTKNQVVSRCYRLYKHRGIKTLKKNELDEIIKHTKLNADMVKNKLKLLAEKANLTIPGLLSRMQHLFGHNSYKKLTESEKQELIDYIPCSKTQGYKVSDIVRVTGRSRRVVNQYTNKIGMKTNKGKTTIYTEEQYNKVVELCLKGNESKKVKTIHEKKYNEIENFKGFENVDNDYLNNISWFYDYKYSILKTIKEDFNYTTYKRYKSDFRLLLNYTLSTLKDDCGVKKDILSILKLDSVKYKQIKEPHYCRLTKEYIQAYNEGVLNSKSISRHFLYTAGQLQEILDNFDKWHIVESNFATLLCASDNLPVYRKFINAFRKKHNIKYDSLKFVRKKVKQKGVSKTIQEYYSV